MANPIQVLKPDHIVLNVRDIDRSLHFYTQVLGLKVERLEDFRAGKVGFPSVRMGEQLIDLFPLKAGKPTEVAANSFEPFNHFCLRIKSGVSWEEVQAYLRDNNVTIVNLAPNNWGAWGYGDSLYIRDPDNNLLELKQYQD
jgi:catechol 2,3-dioxygenase-like lactoylglutathione lyase family enzyme